MAENPVRPPATQADRPDLWRQCVTAGSQMDWGKAASRRPAPPAPWHKAGITTHKKAGLSLLGGGLWGTQASIFSKMVHYPQVKNWKLNTPTRLYLTVEAFKKKKKKH